MNTIDEFLAQFPPIEKTDGLPFDQTYCTKERIEYDLTPDVFYVAPSFSDESSPIDSNPANACLISAPAAVGKTSLAKYLQRELFARGRHVVYAPLKGKNIGDYFFRGLLGGLFTGASQDKVREELLSGRLVIIFDGYDEVAMTTEQMELNRGFVKEIVDFFEGTSDKQKSPSILFQFRSVFFEFGIFDALVPRARHLRVNYFEPAERRKFLNGYLALKSSNKFSNEGLVDKFLGALERRLGAAAIGINPAAFFGHALVLGSFGDFIIAENSPNLIKLANELGAENVDSAISLRILKPIIDTIIRREEEKLDSKSLRSNISDFNGYPSELQERCLSAFAYAISTHRAGEPWEEKSQFISAEGQKLLDASLGFKSLGASDKQKLQEQYEEMLLNQFDHHPFVDPQRSQFTNQIYHEYYLAKYLANEKVIDIEAIFEHYKSASYFLALFFLDCAPGRDLTSHSNLVHYLVNLLSMSCNGEEYSVDIRYNKQANHWRGNVKSDNVQVPDFFLRDEILNYRVQPGSIVQNVDFAASEAGLLSISSPSASYEKKVELRNTTIDVLHLQIEIPYLVIDGVTIQCDELELDRAVLQIAGSETLTIRSSSGNLKITTQAGQEKIRPLLEEAQQTEVQDIEQFKRKLAKVLLGFRKHKRSQYGVYELRHRNLATGFGKDKVATSIVSMFFDKKIFSRYEGLLVLDQDKLAAFGVHYIQQNKLDFKDGGKKLYSEWQKYA